MTDLFKNNNPIHIVYDIDDVLADFWDTALPLFNKRFAIGGIPKLVIDDITGYNTFLDVYGINSDQFLEFVSTDVHLGKLKPTEYLQKMNYQYRCGHKISIVTSRDYIPDADSMTRLWLYDIGAMYHDLHISGKKKKSEFFSVGDVGLVYDDHSNNIDDYIDSGVLSGMAVIVDKPWNRQYKRDGVLRYIYC